MTKSSCEHSRRIRTSYWKCCCTGKVIWQREKEEHRYDADRFKDPTSRPVAWRKTHESHCLHTLRTTGCASAQRGGETYSPSDHEVLIRIYATTVTTADCELRSLRLPIWLRLPIRLYLGLIRPRNIILGQELAGEIEAVGSRVTRLRKGDQVFAWTGLRLGAYAQYTCLPEKGMLAIKPATMTYEAAAAVPLGGLNAWHFLRQGNVQSG